MQGISVGITGTRVICCVHDRVKREVTTEAHVADLGLRHGYVYDPVQHKLWACACCENLFVDPTDKPRYCRTCQGPPKHQPAGPLPAPNERPLDG